MRYSSARQMIFEAYHTRRGDSAIAGLFDNLKRIRERVGTDGSKLRSLIAQHKRNVRRLLASEPDDPMRAELEAAVRLTERQLSEVRIALEDSTKSSNEGMLPDNDWKIVSGLEAGAVISRVEALPQHLRALVLVSFGPFTREELVGDVEWVHLALYRAMLERGIRCPGQGQGRPTAEMLEQLRWLCRAALHHHAEATYPYNRAGLDTSRKVAAWLSDECGVTLDVRRWSQSGRWSWSDVWERALTILDDWESQALAPVAALIPRAA